MTKKKNFIETVGMALSEIGFLRLVIIIYQMKKFLKHIKNRKIFQLSDQTKNSYVVEGIQGQRGFTAFGVEHAKNHDAPDLKEFWHIGQEIDEPKYSEEYPDNVLAI